MASSSLGNGFLHKRWARLALMWAVSLIAAPAFADVRYILEVAPGTAGSGLAAKYGLTLLRSWQSDTHLSYSVSAPQALAAAALGRLKSEPGVRDVEVDADLAGSEADTSSRARAKLESLGAWFPFRGTVPFYGARVHSGYVSQPGTDIVRADEGQRSFGLGSGIVAVIDTGVDTNHAALRDVLLPGYDFTRNRADTVSEFNDLDPATASALMQSTVEILDGERETVQLNPSTVAILEQSTVEILDGHRLPSAFGHGTMVAGLIHRIAPGARIMPLKAFRADGSAALSDIVRAILYAADHGANVISMSFGFASPSAELQSAITYAQSRGVLCVASAGNSGKPAANYPASFKYVIGVGSTNFSDKRSPFSNFGGPARTSAPGEALVTTFPGNNYAGVWGTSFSAALVSGTLTIFRQNLPREHYGDVMDALEYGARIDQDMGDARLDVVRSITYLLQHRD